MKPGHQLVLLVGGDELFPALIEAMDAARQVVHLETYIFEFAGSALGVAEALERTARRGVEVRLVVDGVGTPVMPQEWRQRFDAAGVQWRIYSPLGRFGLLFPRLWRRLHRKLCVVDGTVGFCGGVNIIDDRDDVALGRLDEPRLDYSLRVAGPLVQDMTETMEQLWWRLKAARAARQREFAAAWQALRGSSGSGRGDFSRLLRKLGHRARGLTGGGGDEEGSTLMGVDDARAALLLRDNVAHRHDIERSYLKAIGEARQEVLIVNAYFIPGRKLRRALLMAVQRGVRVRLLLQGRYEHFLQYRAARPVLKRLVNAGMEICEYAPSALHAKVAVVDERWATVGSTNLDPLSMLLAREANVTTTDRRFAALLREQLDDIVCNRSNRMEAHALNSRPWGERILDRIAFGVMRTVLFLTGHRY
ncbi:MAG TPA: cardiolipin synthase ClsB [Hydrogenophaga sp.]|uniref:cardiolipin synthase ClsB n=1 Tax=Hydrogenophaga sp. TaxID=1904254 RepID=UPI002C258181|nr:cardiolipin synthase ClsB [Hydrogenophaga sp.]HSX94435.1 cardiolipin synthase ClsB [Hydrogenophaga sp.]